MPLRLDMPQGCSFGRYPLLSVIAAQMDVGMVQLWPRGGTHDLQSGRAQAMVRLTLR